MAQHRWSNDINSVKDSIFYIWVVWRRRRRRLAVSWKWSWNRSYFSPLFPLCPPLRGITVPSAATRLWMRQAARRLPLSSDDYSTHVWLSDDVMIIVLLFFLLFFFLLCDASRCTILERSFVRGWRSGRKRERWKASPTLLDEGIRAWRSASQERFHTRRHPA